MDKDYEYLLLAFEEAVQANEEGTFPIGAVIVDAEGNVISRGRNKVFSECDPTAHAEVDAIRKIGPYVIQPESKRLIAQDKLTLYTTCEPCPMCTGTIVLSKIKRVVWAANDTVIGAFKLFQAGAGVLPAYHQSLKEIEISAAPYPDLEARQRKLLADWNIKRGYTDTYWLDATEQKAD